MFGKACFSRDVSLTCVPEKFVLLFCICKCIIPILLTVMSPSIVEVGELCVVRQIESFAADSSVGKVMTSIPPGVELLYQTKYMTMVFNVGNGH